MGLPFELLQYAENLYRRFPEEFIALGMPGLEEIYDLRPNGTWQRRMHETPTDKTVEITIRRWQTPSLVPPQMMAAMGPPPKAFLHPQQAAANGYGYAQQQHQQHQQQQHQQQQQQQQQQQMMAAYYATHPSSTPAPPPPVRAPTPTPCATSPAGGVTAEEQASTMRLARLETVLSALKPQIEALLVAQAQPQPQAQPLMQAHAQPHAQSHVQAQAQPQPQAPPQAAMHRQPVAAYTADGVQSSHDKKDHASSLTPDSNELRVRRAVSNLQIQICPKAKAQEKQAHMTPPVVKINDADSEGVASSDEPLARASVKVRAGADSDGGGASSDRPARVAQRDAQRQRPDRVHPVRVADSAADPASPRSPGRYSAWK